MKFDFQNNGAVVLTTQEPGAFLNFRWEPGDPSIELIPRNISGLGTNKLWVNGMDISQDASIYDPDSSVNYYLRLSNTGDPSVASFFLYTRELGPFDTNLAIDVSTDFSIPNQVLESWSSNPGSSWSTFNISGRNVVQAQSLGNLNSASSNDFIIPLGSSVDISVNLTIISGSTPVFGFTEKPSGNYTSLPLSAGQNNFSVTPLPGTTHGYLTFLNILSSINFSANFDVDVSFFGSFDVSVLNRPYIVDSNNVNIFETSNVQVEGDTSYLLLRTNPKFGGNIKLTIDSSNHLFLDTFKVSDVLTNKLYRKQSISAESVLSGDIRRVFSSMPRGEMYRLGRDETLNIAIPETDLYNQYDLEYSYGARIFADELYPEDYSMIAPLWVNNKLPDYFAIFRIPGVFNQETYPGVDETEDLTSLAEKYLVEGELMESWGIKEGAPLGNYLRNHLSELSQVISPMFLSLSDPEQKDPDPNTWYGMAIDSGIITGRSETTYFFDQKASNFTDLNAFVSSGFERLNLLCPNLINMEFIFNDPDVSLYSMNRYYGLYLTENPLYHISYYADTPDGSINIISLDGKDSDEFFSSSLFNTDGSIKDSYQNRIFTLDDILSIKRITNVNQVNGTDKDYIEEWLNKPGENIFSVKVENIENLMPFISLEINNLLQQGEHLRIVDKTDFKIWEIYGIDIDILDAGESWTYATTHSSPGYPTIYRAMFSIKGSKEDQNEAIWKAWNVFQDYSNTPFKRYKKKELSHSLIIEEWAADHDLKFQRLTSQTTTHIFDTSMVYDPSSSFNTSANYSDIKFYGNLSPTLKDFERVKYDSSYGPINFELYGDRLSIMIDIFDPRSYHLYSMDESISDLFEENMLYLAPDNWYRLVEFFDVSTAIDRSLRYVEDPTVTTDNVMVITKDSIVTVDQFWNAYAVYPLTISLMGINPVKDFDYTVYDSSTLDFKSEYWYKREDDPSTLEIISYPDSSITIECINAFEITEGDGSIYIGSESSAYSAPFSFNTFDNNALIYPDSSTRINYFTLDGSAEYKSYKNGYSEEQLYDYYLNYNVSDGQFGYFYGAKKLKYGLTVPYVTKWVGVGNDCRNNPLRLILDSSILDVSTNFIPFGDNFNQELFYPSFKYLSSGTRAWEDYVFFDINDSVKYEIDGSTYYSSFKEYMLEDPYVDVFSKLVYSNNNVEGTKLRSSIVYYNDYKNTIDGIINGLNLSFKVVESAKNVIDIQDWNRFRISAIAVPSRNRDYIEPMEVFINENTETILLVWYQGNDILNYNYRYSSYMPGKGLLDPNSIVVKDIPWRGFEHDDPYFSHVKTPFGVNNASLSSNIFNIYGIDATYDGSIASPFMQNNLNFGDNLFSIFNAYDGNELSGSGFNFFNRSYDTFRQFVSYSYAKSDATYGALVNNQPYSYIQNANFYLDNTCNLESLKYIFNQNKVQYYIFRGDTIIPSSSFSVNPVEIRINDPREYSGMITYNGWYKPKFNNILEFSYNEEKEIIDVVEKDFTFANTDLRSYKNIPQMWYNKVVNEMTSADVSIANAIDYKKNFNPFKSQWDSGYYFTYVQSVSGAQTKTEVDGYNSTLELPSYFGSKLIKLPAKLALDSWESTTTSEELISTRLSLSYNLTRTIVNIFKNKDTFINNWSNLTQSDNIIDGYIKTTVLGYYNISKPKIGVQIWRKSYSGAGSRLAYSLDSSFTEWKGSNVEGVLNFINNEYIYTINVNPSPAFEYFVKFTLFEK